MIAKRMAGMTLKRNRRTSTAFRARQIRQLSDPHVRAIDPSQSAAKRMGRLEKQRQQPAARSGRGAGCNVGGWWGQSARGVLAAYRRPLQSGTGGNARHDPEEELMSKRHSRARGRRNRSRPRCYARSSPELEGAPDVHSRVDTCSGGCGKAVWRALSSRQRVRAITALIACCATVQFFRRQRELSRWCRRSKKQRVDIATNRRAAQTLRRMSSNRFARQRNQAKCKRRTNPPSTDVDTKRTLHSTGSGTTRSEPDQTEQRAA